jgi:hypothetical protein
MGRVVLRTAWEENIEWNLFSVQFLIRPFLETYTFNSVTQSKLKLYYFTWVVIVMYQCAVLHS